MDGLIGSRIIFPAQEARVLVLLRRLVCGKFFVKLIVRVVLKIQWKI